MCPFERASIRCKATQSGKHGKITSAVARQAIRALPDGYGPRNVVIAARGRGTGMRSTGQFAQNPLGDSAEFVRRLSAYSAHLEQQLAEHRAGVDLGVRGARV